MMLVVKWRFGWCLSPRRRHLKTPQKRKSRVETFLHYCDLVLSSTVNSVDSIYRLTLIVNQHRSRWNLVTSVFVLLRLRHIRATLKPSSSISSWRQATKIPTPAHDLVFKQLGFKFSFSTLNAHSSNPLPMLGHVFRTKLLSPIYVLYINIDASGHHHHQSLWYYSTFYLRSQIGTNLFGGRTQALLTSLRQHHGKRRLKYSHNSK